MVSWLRLPHSFKKKFSLGFFLALLSSSLLLAQEATIVVVVHPDNPVDTLSQKEMIEIFQGEQTRWPNGQKILVIDRPIQSEARALFYPAYLEVPPETRFRKKGSPLIFNPLIQSSDQEVIQTVSFLQNTISYVEQKNVTPQCKVLKIE